jgi:hypothetical protein
MLKTLTYKLNPTQACCNGLKECLDCIVEQPIFGTRKAALRRTNAAAASLGTLAFIVKKNRRQNNMEFLLHEEKTQHTNGTFAFAPTRKANPSAKSKEPFLYNPMFKLTRLK